MFDYDEEFRTTDESQCHRSRHENPKARFRHGDTRRFPVQKGFAAVLVGGRGFTYMTSNDDVLSALRCVRQALRPKGVLVFDNFNAVTIFRDLAKPLRDEVRVGSKTISRLSSNRAQSRDRLGGQATI